MKIETIRRRENGTIDVDFYRQRALTERAAVMSSTGRSIGHMAQSVLAAVQNFGRTSVRARPLPDPGAMMLIAQAASKRPPI